MTAMKLPTQIGPVLTRPETMEPPSTPGQERIPSLMSLDTIQIQLALRPSTLPHTPPDSLSGSPKVKREGLSSGSSSPCPSSPPVSHAAGLSGLSTPSTSPSQLPSIFDFDKGVAALARRQPIRSRTPSSPLSRLNTRASQARRPPANSHFFTQPYFQSYESSSPASFYTEVPTHYAGTLGLVHGQGGYPSPAPDSEDRHINQRYTIEQGDFIIYCWHDRRMRWERIQTEFAERFGSEPNRTVQGLQAWYYRMNKNIPKWNDEGYLRFENDDDLEPQYISIRRRAAANLDLGLAQRYPERAIRYPWVDSDCKAKALDWARKREYQYRAQKERRREKEMRRSGSAVMTSSSPI